MKKQSSDIQGSSDNFIKYCLFFFLIGFCCYLLVPEIKFYSIRSYQNIIDRFDKRPRRYVLFIGNSRTHYHDMPYMVRYIADSAQDPFLYSIAMHAPSGEAFKGHNNNSALQKSLSKAWTHIVLQAASGENLTPGRREDFYNEGISLIKKIKSYGHKPPFLFTTWKYESGFYDYENANYRDYAQKYKKWYQGNHKDIKDQVFKEKYPPDFYPFTPEKHIKNMLEDHNELANRTESVVVNIAQAWEQLRDAIPDDKLLTVDGNHPKIQGSYFCALIFYALFSGQDISKVTYKPSSISEAEAKIIRNAANSYVHEVKLVQ